MEIIVRIAQQYGNRVVIPVCAKAQLFASIAGTRTLTPSTVQNIKTLGYTVFVKQEEVVL